MDEPRNIPRETVQLLNLRETVEFLDYLDATQARRWASNHVKEVTKPDGTKVLQISLPNRYGSPDK